MNDSEHGNHQAKLANEIAAYERMHPALRSKYLGEWVAIHEQELVDHDGDHAKLYLRVRAKYRESTVLMRRVGEQPVQELWFRSPRLEKISE